MALPLMPSTELFQPKPEPEPVARCTGSGYYKVPGCQCVTCVGAQPATYDEANGGQPSLRSTRHDVQGFQRGVYDSSACPAAQWAHGLVRWRIPGTLQVCDESGRSQWAYDEELPDGSLVCTEGSNTGARWVPDAVPVPIHVIENGLVRGQYTQEEGVNGVGLAGRTRWLDTAAGRLYSSADPSGLSLSRGLSELPNGTWRSVSGLVWEAT